MYIPRVWILLKSPERLGTLIFKHLSLVWNFPNLNISFYKSLDTAPKLLNSQKKSVLFVMVWTLSKLFKCYQNHFQMKTNLFKVNFTTLGIFKCIFTTKRFLGIAFYAVKKWSTNASTNSLLRKKDGCQICVNKNVRQLLGLSWQNNWQIVPKSGLLYLQVVYKYS
jgi:hypothetical protein